MLLNDTDGNFEEDRSAIKNVPPYPVDESSVKGLIPTPIEGGRVFYSNSNVLYWKLENKYFLN